MTTTDTFEESQTFAAGFSMDLKENSDSTWTLSVTIGSNAPVALAFTSPELARMCHKVLAAVQAS